MKGIFSCRWRLRTGGSQGPEVARCVKIRSGEEG